MRTNAPGLRPDRGGKRARSTDHRIHLKDPGRISVTIRCQIEFMKTCQDLGITMPGWSLIRETVTKAARPQVECSGTCRDIEVFSDPMLEKVFFNLFENAIQYGGRVMEITVRCERTPDGLVITVEDKRGWDPK
ncbi:MAG: ATP-binding protein [Methanoregulaceae archaeon]|nr:MAG: ATP-binding protein [Methanoregulaceae archaeon]